MSWTDPLTRRRELLRATARLSVRHDLTDLHAADAQVTRGPCGAWHYAGNDCATCADLAGYVGDAG